MKSAVTLPLWLLAAALALPLLGLTSPLIEVDDARYAQVPAEMAASGDWVLPTLDGTPYVEKPPLFYWTAAASYKVFGVSEAAARVPMWLFGLLGVLGAGWLGSWLYSAAVGRAAAAATATAGLWLFLNHNMTLDLPVSVCLLWTTALALRALERPDDARWAAPAAWVAAALAFMSKGLIALVLPGAWVVGLAVIFPRLRTGALRLLSPVGLAAFAALTVPWFWAMQDRRPDFLHVFFIEQHFQRYLTGKYNRGAPWWFYLAVVPGGMLPWTAPFLAGMWRAARKPFGPDFRGPALGYWVLGVCAFFSTSHSKLATYALPVFPHAAVLAAAALDEGLPAWAEKLSRALGALLLAAGAGAVLAAALGVLPASAWPPAGLPPSSLAPLCALAFGLLAALGLAQLFAPSLKRPAAALAAGGTLAGILLFGGLRLAAPLVSVKSLGLAVRAQAAPGDQVWTYDTYLHGLPFYAGRPVDRILQFTGEFHYAKRDRAYDGRFGDAAALKLLPRAGGRTFVAMRTKERPRFEGYLGGGPASVESWTQSGPWSLAVVRAAR